MSTPVLGNRIIGDRRKVIRDDDDGKIKPSAGGIPPPRTAGNNNGSVNGSSNIGSGTGGIPSGTGTASATGGVIGGTGSGIVTSSSAASNAAKLAEIRRRRVYDFSETNERILAKYANEPASLELHIHHTHYRFGNQEGILPKNTSSIKTFFEYIAAGEIPPAATEVFRDSGIRFYEGCIIIKLIDHRNVPVQAGQQNTGGAGAGGGGATGPASGTAAATTTTTTTGSPSDPANSANPTTGSADTATATVSEGVDSPTSLSVAPAPASYRVLLRPTPLSLWHDLLYTADTSHGRFSDQLALSMEAEILSLTTRNIDLRVPDRAPPVYEEYSISERKRKPENEKLSKDEAIKKLHKYRLTNPKKRRGLHEDVAHHGTEYEELMLIMDERQSSANANGASVSGGQFMRLSFIEQLRKKKERLRILSQQQRMQQQIQQNQTGSPQQQQSAFGTIGQSQDQAQTQQLQLQQQQQQQAAADGSFVAGAGVGGAGPGSGPGPTSFSAGLLFNTSQESGVSTTTSLTANPVTSTAAAPSSATISTPAGTVPTGSAATTTAVPTSTASSTKPAAKSTPKPAAKPKATRAPSNKTVAGKAVPGTATSTIKGRPKVKKDPKEPKEPKTKGPKKASTATPAETKTG